MHRSRVAHTMLTVKPPAPDVVEGSDELDDFLGVMERVRSWVSHDGRGLAWTGWRPHLRGRWRLWRSGNAPLEVDGLCLTPRPSLIDPIPPGGNTARFLGDITGRNTDGYGGDPVEWPDHHVWQMPWALRVSNERHSWEEGFSVWDQDVLLIAADSGRWVLAWTVNLVRDVVVPPRGEVIDRAPEDGRWPLQLVAAGSGRPGLICNAVVFDEAAELRDYVDINPAGHTVPDVTLLRWAVDVAAEAAPELDGPARGEVV